MKKFYVKMEFTPGMALEDCVNATNMAEAIDNALFNFNQEMKHYHTFSVKEATSMIVIMLP